jgi:Ca2+-binding RTX toxin-like protein
MESTASTGDYQIDSLLSGSQWNTTTITYSFFSCGGYYGSETGVSAISESVKNNVRNIIENYIEPFINVNFVEVADSASNYGQLRYMFSNEPEYAYAYNPGSASVNGDVHLNPSFANTTFNGFEGGPGTHGFMSLIHETLHALGLKHPGNYDGAAGGTSDVYLSFGEDNTTNTVMTYNFVGNSAATLMPDDLKALQYLYGAKSYNTLNTTYSFNSVYGYSDGSRYWGSATTPMKLTIWDSGGTDTLNFSSLAFDAEGYRFDLKEGGILTSESAYNGTSYKATGDTSGTTYYTSTFGTAIAYGAIIENATGSSSNDTIIGNSANNYLSGNDGNDSLYGNAGNDYLDGGIGNDKLSGKTGVDTLVGSMGSDRLVGGFGTDILTGGAGADRFIRKYSYTGVDTITDFNVAEDRFSVSASGFGGELVRGEITQAQFTVGEAALDESDASGAASAVRFIYDSTTGGLFFDADGIGFSEAIQVAQLSSDLALTHASIFVFA